MRFLAVFIGCLSPLFVTTVSGEADVDAGKGHFQACIACHGDKAQGNADFSAPRLSHLQAEYIAVQLNNFRAGIRGGEGTSEAAQQMGPMASTLPDSQAIEDVAAYISSLPGAQASAAIEGDAAMGADYFNQFCGACHGASAQGNVLMTAVAPTLAGASDWYLVAQLQAFQAGVRGAHKDDRGGRQMRPMSRLLPDQKAIEDVVAFIHSLGK